MGEDITPASGHPEPAGRSWGKLGGARPRGAHTCARPRGKVCAAARAREKVRARPPSRRAAGPERQAQRTGAPPPASRPTCAGTRAPGSNAESPAPPPKSEVWAIAEPIRWPPGPGARAGAAPAGGRAPIHSGAAAGRRAGGRARARGPALLFHLPGRRGRAGRGRCRGRPANHLGAWQRPRPLPPARSLLPNCYPECYRQEQ